MTMILQTKNRYSIALRQLCPLLMLLPAFVWAQQLEPSVPHGFYDQPFALSLIGGEEAVVRYTLDGSEPTVQSEVYEAPLTISGTTILRAAAFNGGERTGDILTATYLFVNDVLGQSNTLSAGVGRVQSDVGHGSRRL